MILSDKPKFLGNKVLQKSKFSKNVIKKSWSSNQIVCVDLIYQSHVHWSPELRWTDEKLRYDDDGQSTGTGYSPRNCGTALAPSSRVRPNYKRTVDKRTGALLSSTALYCTGCRRTAGAPSRNHYSTHYTPFLRKSMLRNRGD